MNRQVEIKCDQIARMIVKGMKCTVIAIEMGMSYDGLMRIVRQPEYLAIEERVRNEVVGKMDARLAKRAEMSSDVEDAIPEALQVLLDGVKKKRDLKAALELLDRDPRGQFTKNASRSAAQAAASPGVTATPLASEALANAVREADITHTILEKERTAPKAAEA